MELTKKYRVILEKDSKLIQGNYTDKYNKGSITRCSDKNIEGFESDNLIDIEKYIEKNELIQIENEIL